MRQKPKEMADRILKATKPGVTTAQIAEHLGCSRTYILQVWKQHGITPPDPNALIRKAYTLPRLYIR